MMLSNRTSIDLHNSISKAHPDIRVISINLQLLPKPLGRCLSYVML